MKRGSILIEVDWGFRYSPTGPVYRSGERRSGPRWNLGAVHCELMMHHAVTRGWFMGWLTVSGGVSAVCLTVSLLLSDRLRGRLVIRFLSGGRLDDRNYAISGVFRPIPSNSVPVSWILPSHFLVLAPYGRPGPKRGQWS
jgi:hypothetical protein